MPFTYEEKCFVKIHRLIYMFPNSPDLNQVDYSVYEGLCSRAYIALWFPTWTISKTCRENLDQNLNQKIDKSIDHWRDKPKAVVRLHAVHIEQLFW